MVRTRTEHPHRARTLTAVIAGAVVAVASGVSAAAPAFAAQQPGTVVVWGSTFDPEVTDAVAVADGSYTHFALRANGTVVAWGHNPEGPTDVVPDGLSGVTAIAASAFAAYALKADGTVTVWGSNGYGELNVPPTVTNVVAIDAGGGHALALKADGTVVAWGSGGTAVPAGLRDVVAVSAGSDHSLALKSDGTVVAWGANDYGQAVVPAGLSGVVKISAGGDHNLALKSDGTVVAWGRNDFAQARISPWLGSVADISAGASHTVVLLTNGTVLAWGLNDVGQTNVPLGLSNVAAISAGVWNTLALVAPRDYFAPTITCDTPAPTFALGQDPARVYATLVDETDPASAPVFAVADTTTLGSHTVNVTGTDSAGNRSIATCPYQVVAHLDTTAPVITCDTPAPTFTLGQDPATVYATLVDETAPTSLRLSAAADTSSVGSKAVTIAGSDTAGNAASARCGYEVVPPPDQTPPVVTCASPAPVFTLNQSPARVYATLVDETGPVSATISAAADTGSVGVKAVTVAGTDTAGNPGSASCGYQVTYSLLGGGFTGPVDSGILNDANAGRAIPFKFSVLDAAGVPVTTLSTATSKAVAFQCGTGMLTDAIEEYATGASGLQNLGGGAYQFNFKTLKTWAGTCRTLGIDLGDGRPLTADFRFR